MKKSIRSLFVFVVLCVNFQTVLAEENAIGVWGTAVSPYVRKVISVLEEKKSSMTCIPYYLLRY